MSQLDLVPDLAADLDWVRRQFPALELEVDGRPAAYFDGPGGTQVPARVIDAIGDYLRRSNANTHGAFPTSLRSDEVVAETHRAAADLLGCSPREVVFGPNMTTLTFALSRAIGRELSAGDEIVLTKLDHDANFAPWKALEETGATVRAADIDPADCTLDMEGLLALIGPKTKLVAVGYASNAVGTVNDVARIIEAAHAVGAWAFVDAVHYAPHGPLDVAALDCDFLACSPYKFFGPHQGLLYGKAEHLERLRPYKVRPADDGLPDRWETGTQSHEAMAGVTAAIDYLAELGRRRGAEGERGAQLRGAMRAIQAYERTLSERLVAGLLAIPGLDFYGIREPERFDRRTPTVAIRLPNRSPREIAQELGRQGIFVWDGNYYALNLSERLGVEPNGGMVRIGATHYTTAEEIDRLLEALRALS